MRKEISLNGSDWKLLEFKPNCWRGHIEHMGPEGNAWTPATVPGVVQADLIAAGKLPAEPYRDLNSKLCEWVFDRDWVYYKDFEAPAELQGTRVFLRFEGVDYSSYVYLNGQRLGHHEGAFVPFEFDVSAWLKYGEKNRLAVAVEHAPDEQSQIGWTTKVSTAKSRVFYGWDFSTRMVPLGIWEDVKLVATGSARLTDLWVRARLNDDLSAADLAIEATIHSDTEGLGNLVVEILSNGKVVAVCEVPHVFFPGESHSTATVFLDRPALWWPNGMGDQPLYEARAKLLLEDEVLSDQRTVSFGIRRIRAIANQGAPADALPYTLEVNGRRVFMRGWNWVPLDHLIGTDLDEKYRRMIRVAKEANVNLLRVWGGGLIEKEIFYRLCDEAGIMVWQEFILSSSGHDNKPSCEPAYLELVRRQAEGIVPRRRNHASLAIWCGGNELMFLDGRPCDCSEPAIAIMESVVRRLDPGRIFLPTSASGPVEHNGIDSIGRQHDVHGPWKYSGTVDHYRLFNEMDALLHSEFGTDGASSLKSLRRFVSTEKIWPPDRTNEVWMHHGEWWINMDQVQGLFGPVEGIESFVRASQYLQVEGLRYQIEANQRRMWRCSGTLPWQINEPWPNTSCTCCVDYYTDLKPAYYAVKRAYEPLHVSAKYETIQWHGREEFSAEIWLVNHGESRPLKVRTLLAGLDGKPLAKPLLFDTEAPTNGARAVGTIHWRPEGHQGVFVLFVQALGEGDRVLSESFYLHSTLPEPIYAPLLGPPEASLSARVENGQVVLRNEGKAFALMVSADEEVEPGRFVSLSDNHFVIPPGEEKRIIVTPDGWTGPLGFRGWNTNRVAVSI